MKKIFFLLAIALISSCNKSDDTIERTTFDEPDFLLSRIITHYDNDEITGNETLAYTYDGNHNPLSLNRIDVSGNTTQVLQFVYTNTNQLTEIVFPAETYNGITTYDKAVVQTFNDTEALFIVQKYDDEDNLIEPLLYEVRFEFDGFLIKSLLTTPNPDYATGEIYTNLTHDDEGKLLSFSNGTIGFEPINYEVTEWDNNAITDNVNYFSRSFHEIKYWLPKHYISTKNPSMVFHTNDSFHIMVAYELDASNGTVAHYVVSDDNSDPDYYDYSATISKEYIKVN